MNIKGSKILITGGAGFIGSHIAESLVQCGAEVTVFDNLSCGSLENLSSIKSNINFVKGDILDAHALAEVVKDQDIVSHQAAQLEIILATSNPSWDLRVNTEGTLNVLETSKRAGVKKIINASSACVYGQKSGLTRETDPRHPNWTYGVSKLAAEEYGKIYSDYKSLPVVSLRYSIVYGEKEWLRRALSLFLKKAIDGLQPVVFGSGDQVRDFIYVGDVVAAHNKCIENDEINGEVFNIGSGIGTNIAELARKIAALFLAGNDIIIEDIDEGAESQLVPGKRRNAAELTSMLLNISKAKEKISWQPLVPLEEGLRREFNWAKENSHRWQRILYTDNK